MSPLFAKPECRSFLLLTTAVRPNAAIGGKHDRAVAKTLGCLDPLGDVDLTVADHGELFLIVVSIKA